MIRLPAGSQLDTVRRYLVLREGVHSGLVPPQGQVQPLLLRVVHPGRVRLWRRPGLRAGQLHGRVPAILRAVRGFRMALMSCNRLCVYVEGMCTYFHFGSSGLVEFQCR